MPDPGQIRPRSPRIGPFASLDDVKRTHVAAVAALVLVASPALTGCFNGPRATTTTQATMNTGNGTEARQGDLQVENATLVLGPEGSKSGTLIMRVVNTGIEPDALTYATINGVQATITDGNATLSTVEIAPGASVPFGYDATTWVNTYALEVEQSSWVPVELGFEKAGLLTVNVLTVPAVGYYEGIAPNPPMAAVPAS